MKHLKVFETTALFEAARTTLDLPNVSLIEENYGIQFLPYVEQDPYNGHDYVEIGGLKWATMNIGANSITDVGLYFQWGDTQGYTASQVGNDKNFYFNDYKYYDSDYYVYTKYNDTDELVTLQSSDDAAYVAWGGNWRMPTNTEIQTFGNAVNAVWTSNYNNTGIAGLICTDKTDSSKILFFPSTGIAMNGVINASTEAAGYWSSTVSYNESMHNFSNANIILCMDQTVTWGESAGRLAGLPIRAIYDDSNS